MKIISTKYQMPLYILILLLGAVWIGVSASPVNGTTNGSIPAPREGFLAPDFNLQTLDGETIRLSDLRGQAVLINFWASWCQPCRAEMPAMENVFQQYRNQGFTILAINTTNNDSLNAAEAFVAQYGLNFPILLDYKGSAGKAYQMRATPTTFFVDPDGIIQEVVIGGPMTEALLQSRVGNILPEQP